MATPLPPALTLQQLTQAQRAFETALGADKVFFEDLDRRTYQDKFAIDEAAHLPAGAIAPTTRSEEHTSELQSLMRISYAVFCLKKKPKTTSNNQPTRQQ